MNKAQLELQMAVGVAPEPYFYRTAVPLTESENDGNLLQLQYIVSLLMQMRQGA